MTALEVVPSKGSAPEAKPALHDGSDQKPATFSGFLDSELTLFKSLPSNFGKALENNLKDNWPTLVIEAGVGLAVGATVAAVTKNPSLVGRAVARVIGHENPVALGEALSSFVKPTMKALPWGLGALTAIDTGNRIISPGLDLMKNPGHLAQDEAQFATNLASMSENYAVMGITGFAGAQFAFGRTAPYINRGPLLDAGAAKEWYGTATPGQVGKAARFTDGDKYTIAEERHLADDVYRLYNSRFPIAEQQPRESYEEMIAKGHNTVIAYRDKTTGELAAAHILGFHEQPNPAATQTFADWFAFRQPAPLRTVHGDFVFVKPDLARQGLGSHFYAKVVELLQQKGAAEGSPFVGLTGEMEDPAEAAEGVLGALRSMNAKLPADADAQPMRIAEDIWKNFKQNNPGFNISEHAPAGLSEEQQAEWQAQKDKSIAQKLLALLCGNDAPPSSQGDQQLAELGEAFRMLDERVSRRNFYWALTDATTGKHMPKFNSGVHWQIQDFEDPQYRGRAEWTVIPFNQHALLPREAGYAFMTDPAGYGLDPNSPQVLEYMRNNDYYRANGSTAYIQGSLLGSTDTLRRRFQF